MMKIIEKIFDISTGEETIIEREETQFEKNLRIESEENAKIDSLKAQAKAELLNKLGISADEAKLLIS